MAFWGATLVRKLLERGERVKAFVRPETDLSSLRGLPEDRMLLSVGNIMSEGSIYPRAHQREPHLPHGRQLQAVGTRTRKA